jgi:hypothetical protein
LFLVGLLRCLTATSADDGYDRWVAPAAESMAQGVDGVTLEAGANVGVNGGGDADFGLAEQLLDDDEFDALFQEEAGAVEEGGEVGGCGCPLSGS